MWRETQSRRQRRRERNFNPLPPCGGRPWSPVNLPTTGIISIHSLRVEGDAAEHFRDDRWIISIHSLRVEGDTRHRRCYYSIHDFNPLPPCGGRHTMGKRSARSIIFQSTPSVWRETAMSGKMHISYCISIHSLRVEGDHLEVLVHHSLSDFNPLPPCGGRRNCITSNYDSITYFNPLPPCGGRR